ncbi:MULTISPECIES: hypothetical protein [unclassified Streptomyces]|uniref:hypothetical protein n=1 Tax=unclassified Streptomyces TaxID=2593676 RepID=UPI00380A1C9E
MRFRTGLDDDVHAHVLKTPGTLTLIHRTAVQLRALAEEVPAGRLVRGHGDMPGRPSPSR